MLSLLPLKALSLAAVNWLLQLLWGKHCSSTLSNTFRVDYCNLTKLLKDELFHAAKLLLIVKQKLKKLNFRAAKYAKASCYKIPFLCVNDLNAAASSCADAYRAVNCAYSVEAYLIAQLTRNQEPSRCAWHPKSVPGEARVTACIRFTHICKP